MNILEYAVKNLRVEREKEEKIIILSVFAWTKSDGRPPPKNYILQVEPVSRSEPILFPSASPQLEHILECI